MIKEVKCICSEGHMVLRNGLYGPFYGCSEYPKCKNSRKNLEDQPHLVGEGWEDYRTIDYDGDGIGGWAW